MMNKKINVKKLMIYAVLFGIIKTIIDIVLERIYEEDE